MENSDKWYFVLNRKRICKDRIKGELYLENTDFTCLTLEAKDPRGHHPLNPALMYALPEGDFPITINNYSYHPFMPYIRYAPYRNISFAKWQRALKAGNIAIGNEWIYGNALYGFEDVAERLYYIIRDFVKKKEFRLFIKYDTDLIIDDETHTFDYERYY